jgi:hypothetical protein
MALRFLASLLEKLRRMYETYLLMRKLSKSHGVVFLKFTSLLISICTGGSSALIFGLFKQLEFVLITLITIFFCDAGDASELHIIIFDELDAICKV